MTSARLRPVLPFNLLVALAAVALLIVLYSFLVRARGAWARGLAFADSALRAGGPLAGARTARQPARCGRDRHRPLQSMNLGKRSAQAESARVQVRRMMAAQPDLIIRETSITTTTTGENNGTQAFAALNAALADVPPGRVAGAVLITDGQVHDVPSPRQPVTLQSAAAEFWWQAVATRRDPAKLTVQSAARFAIVGQQATMRLRIDDLGGGGETSAVLNIRIDGKPFGNRLVPVGKDTDVRIPVSHEGENLIELSAGRGLAELTLQNNHAVVTVSGVRDRLRVLLVSGEPHAGERVWRNLLKADPSVDLIHFTILRPPDKQDTTPDQRTLADRLPLSGIVPGKAGIVRPGGVRPLSRARHPALAYFQNIAGYVQDGGALLISSGPEFAGPESIYRTPLSQVLPAQPTGEVVTGGFRPRVTEEGLAHPVTARTGGPQPSMMPAPTWGRWFRILGSNKIAGQTVMAGDGGRPLLVLDQVGKGRVAEILSDQTWLWARGFEGGGPQAELLRRLAALADEGTGAGSGKPVRRHHR